MKELRIILDDKSIEIIRSYSEMHNISKERLCEMLINNWSNYGGLLWSSENEKTPIFLIDWPVTRKMVRQKID